MLEMVQISQLQTENELVQDKCMWLQTNFVSNYKLTVICFYQFSVLINFVFGSSVNLYTIISTLCNFFCSDDALKASYLLLKAASNEKQSVDTVDTSVQADYLAVAPG